MPHGFRIGSVHYLNAVPLTYGLGPDVTLLPPSRLAIEMHAGRLDAALLSITEALFHPDHEILDSVGIVSRGPVYSVGLAHRAPLEQVDEVHLDTASCTSVNLLRILLDARGVRPRFVPLTDYNAAPRHENVLLIGNAAIDFRRGPHAAGHRWWDLGEAWQQQERVPFTYAAWVLRRGAPDALRQLLLASAEAGLANLDRIIETGTDYDAAFRRDYLGGYIQYRVDEAARDGIRRFAACLARLAGRPVYAPRFVSALP